MNLNLKLFNTFFGNLDFSIPRAHLQSLFKAIFIDHLIPVGIGHHSPLPNLN